MMSNIFNTAEKKIIIIHQSEPYIMFFT